MIDLLTTDPVFADLLEQLDRQGRGLELRAGADGRVNFHRVSDGYHVGWLAGPDVSACRAMLRERLDGPPPLITSPRRGA